MHQREFPAGWTRLWRRLWPRPADRLRGLHAPRRLREILRRERDRSDRMGDALAMVKFIPRERETREETYDRLAAVLKRRLRLTDDAGWLDDEVIAAVLPHTSAAGAWKVADDVCLAFPDGCPPPLCEVYRYPSPRRAGDSDGHAAGRADGNGHAEDAGRPVAPLEVLFLRATPLWKRSLDVAGGLAALLLLSPLLVLIALGVKLTSRGPVLYRQRRDGWGGRVFTIYKFRSMVADADARKHEVSHLNHQDGPAFKIEDDPRTTWLGRLLRTTSLDELPQIWNVLRGDMSLVGPRPLPCPESATCAGWQRRRLDVTPGLTCIWQIRGCSRVSFDQWIRMDLEYIRRRSLLLDLKLLAQTVPAVLLGRGM